MNKFIEIIILAAPNARDSHRYNFGDRLWLQDISTCTAYPYQIQGTGILGPVVSALAIGTAMDFGAVSSGVSESDDYGIVSNAATTFIDLGNVTS